MKIKVVGSWGAAESEITNLIGLVSLIEVTILWHTGLTLVLTGSVSCLKALSQLVRELLLLIKIKPAHMTDSQYADVLINLSTLYTDLKKLQKIDVSQAISLKAYRKRYANTRNRESSSS